MWNGDGRFWNRHSPLLFPLVGKLRDGRTKINGETYELPKHGFVSDAPFSKIDQNDRLLVYRLESTPEMHRIFPFPFRIDVTYKLRANQLKVIWRVLNTGVKILPFHIGGHPGINYPEYKQGSKVKAYAGFRRPSPIESAAVGSSGCLSEDRYDIPMVKNLLEITDECFKNDAIIIDRSQVKYIALYDLKQRPYVSMDFDAPVLLLWSPYGVDAPFVCLEPWYGLCDAENFKGDFYARPYTNVVAPGHYVEMGYTLHMDAEISRSAMSIKKEK